MIRNFMLLCVFLFSSVMSLQADYNFYLPMGEKIYSKKMYIDEEEFSTNGDAFHIHIGENVWLVTRTVHRDATGLYTYECDLVKDLSGIYKGYEKKWKCPYCFSYWPIGTPCQNPDCPSKYR